MAVLLRITDWAVHFENNRTRELKVMSWLPIPVKLGGDGYTEILDHPNGAAHFGAWIAILEVAAGCDERGTLLRGNRSGVRSPHDAQSISRMTRIPISIIEEALPRLIAAGWITAEECGPNGSIPHESRSDAAPSCGNPAETCGVAAPSRARAELDRRGEESIGVQDRAHDISPLSENSNCARVAKGTPGAPPPAPPIARAPRTKRSDEPRGGDAYAGDRNVESATPQAHRALDQANLPPSALDGRGGAPLPGEEELPQLADDLFAAHPSGAKGGGTAVPTQRALLALLKDGRIWLDRSPPDPLPPPGFGRSFSADPEKCELRACHRRWCARWIPNGDRPPMNLAVTWLGRGRNGDGGMEFLGEPPEPETKRGKANGGPADWNPGSDAATVERLQKEVFG